MSHAIKTILVGTDLEATSDDVVRAGLDVARATGARLHVVHAFSLPLEYFDVPWLSGHAGDELAAEERRLMAKLVEEQIERLGIAEEELAGHGVEDGPAHRALIDKANELQADLLVVGAGTGALLDRAFGSTTDRVFRKATRPVLAVRGALSIPPKKVTFPVDLSPLSADSFRCGLNILGQIDSADQAQAVALYVLNPPIWPTGPTPEMAQQGRVQAAEALENFVDRLAGGESRALRQEVRYGDPRSEIIGQLEDWQPDLVMLGTHGRGGFERLILGSVAAEVSRQAECSTLVIPPEAAQRWATSLDAEHGSEKKSTHLET